MVKTVVLMIQKLTKEEAGKAGGHRNAQRTRKIKINGGGDKEVKVSTGKLCLKEIFPSSL